MLGKINSFLSKLSIPIITLLAGVLMVLFGVVDYLTGVEISFSIVYLMPISLAVWYAGKRSGIVVSIFATSLWLAADMTAGHLYSHPAIPIWNACVRFIFFIVVSILLSRIRTQLQREEQMADTDPLTSLANRRLFFERVQFELERCRRYKRYFTIAYIDLDNFKSINDTQGHQVGDSLLCAVADTLKNNVRQTDITSRLGGDEFAILFSETGYESSKDAISNMQKNLIMAMKEHEWSVTFSIGAVSFEEPMVDVRDMIKLSDDLMYKVKKSGKNRIEHIVWPKEKESMNLSKIMNILGGKKK